MTARDFTLHMGYFNAAVFIFLAVFVVSQSKEEVADISTLRQVHLLYRHGDRSPIVPYKNDPVTESDWPQGLGQLTQIGMEQEYRLGQFLRRRYLETGSFMDKKYNRSQIYVRSSNIERALMSAYCVLNGLYPPHDSQMWNKKIVWQPIPVHTVPGEDDYLLLFRNCPKVDEENEDTTKINSERREKFMLKNMKMINYVAACTGVSADLDGFLSTLDPLFCENRNGKKIPACIKNSTFLDNLISYRDFAASLSLSTPLNIRLRGGALVGTFLEHMQTKSLDVTKGYQLYMYSAHDTNVNVLLRAMGIFDNKQPPYSACVMVELHETKTGKFDVRVFHKDVQDSSENITLRKPTVPGCLSHECPLETFAKVLQKIIPTDVKKECGIGAENLFTTDNVAGISVLSLFLAIFLIILIGVCCHYRQKKGNLMYRPVPTDDL